MTTTTIPYGSNLVLPDNILRLYEIKRDTPVRIIATRNGILLVPLTQAPISAELAQELEEWQALGSDALLAFPFENEMAI